MARVVFGQHVAKTGGTTVSGHVSETLGKDALLRVGPINSANGFFSNARLPEEFTRDEIKKCRFVYGHGVDETTFYLLDPDDHIDLVFITRDPVSHFKSRVKHGSMRKGRAGKGGVNHRGLLYRNDEPSHVVSNLVKRFPSFVDPNAQTLEEKAVSALRAFRFALSTERFDVHLPDLFRWIGAPTRSKARRVRGTAEDDVDFGEDDIVEWNAVDKSINDRLAAGRWNSERQFTNGIGFDPTARDAAFARLGEARPSDDELLAKGYRRLLEGLRAKNALVAALHHLQSGRATTSSPGFLTEMVETAIAEDGISPDDPDQLQFFAAYLLQQGELGACIETGERLLTIRQDDPRNHHTLGMAFLQKSQMHKARDHLAEAVRLWPHQPSWWYWLGRVEHHFGNLTSAKEAYERANKGRGKLAREALDEVNRTLGSGR